MKVLINYNAEEKAYLPIVAGMLKRQGIDAQATSKDLDITQLLALAKSDVVNAQAILCSNEVTLSNLVKMPGKKQATLASFRGSRLNFSVPVIVTNKFSHIRTVKYGKWLLERDIGKIKHWNKTPAQLPFTLLEKDYDFLHAAHILNKCLIVSIDIETTTEGRITCISFTGLIDAAKTVTYVIPFIDFGQEHWDKDRDYIGAIHWMRVICASDVPKMMFNATYDAQYLIRYGAWPNNLVLDVMGMAHSMYSELPKTLDFTTSLWCWDYYQWKHEAEIAKNDNDIRKYWHYCARDSWNTLRCFLYMSSEYPEYAIKNYQMVFKNTYPCLYCSFEGELIDNEERLRKRVDAEQELEKRRTDLRTMAADPNFNPGSPKQVAEFVYDIIGAKPIKGGRGTDAKTFQAISEQHPLLARICDDISIYREKQKEISTYYDFHQWNRRLIYSLGPFATETARFSSRQGNYFTFPLDAKEPEQYGAQIQNIPPYAKSMIIADPGFTGFEADNNKSEARCVAELANSPGLQTVLANTEKDFYKLLAGIFFGIKYEDVTPELRNKVIKRIIHGTNYMMQEDTFIETAGPKQVYEGAALLGIVVTDLKAFARFLLGIYHKRFPEIQEDYKATRNEVLRTGKLVSPMGYTRVFFGNILEDHKIFRSAVAHKPQNLSVTILNKGFWKVYKLCVASNGDLRLKAQIHDSIKGQIRDDKVEYYKPLILEAMNNPVQMPTGRILRIPVDFAVGKTWKQIKEGG